MSTRRFITALAIAVTAQSLGAQNARRPFLFKDARGELATARAKGEKDVLLLVASVTGANARVAKMITAWGGTIKYRDDDVDYIRARVPLDSVDKLAAHKDVHAVDLNVFSGRTYSEPSNFPERPDWTVFWRYPGGAPLSSLPLVDSVPVWPPVLSQYPLTNRYDPIPDMGAAEFRAKNPTFDGRGVTIAMIDMNPDPLLPELQVAKSLDGKDIQKISHYETSLDGDEKDGAGRWLRMNDTVTATAAQITFQGKTYTVPRAATYRIAILDESKHDSTHGGFEKDINRDGNPEGSSRLFAVIWDEKTNDVWVDTNQNMSFTDETALSDFENRPVFGVFGKDDPKTPVRESLGFGVQIDRARKYVGINIGTAGHGSGVVGASLASRGRAGKFDGVAPGARLASVAEGLGTYGQTEAVIRALKNPNIDLAFCEQNSSISNAYHLRDGRLVTTVIYARLIEKYKKPIVVPTHNNPILGAIDDIAYPKGGIAIGAYQSGKNFFTNYGFRTKYHDGLHTTGGYGPMGDGGIGPDIISPSGIISTAIGFKGTETSGMMAGMWRMPPGYRIAGGTSTATPTAAGAVALLISAAKQAGVKYDAYRIKHAITMAARQIEHIPQYKQGNGVVDVGRAWEVLKSLDTVSTVTITARAPVKHAYSHLLPTPNEGVGLFERDGWSVGDRGERTVTLTRTSGPKGTMSFSASWTGNTGNTFTAPTSIELPLNKPVPIRIAVAPTTPGVHSSLLTLDNPNVPGHAYRMMAVVVAAEPLVAEKKFTVETKTEVPRPEMRSYFYRVPEGLSALRIEVDAPKRDVGVTIVRPDVRSARSVRLGAAAITAPAMPGAGRPKATYMVTDVYPGVWEVRLADMEDTRNFDIEASEKGGPVPPTQVTLTVSGIKVDATASTGTSGTNGGETHTVEISAVNRGAAFSGVIGSLPVGAARRERPTIREKEQQIFEIEVPKGSALLSVKLSGISAGADLDVYVHDCTGKECKPSGAGANPTGDEMVVVQNPAAGKWKIVVDAMTTPPEGATFDYTDIVFSSAYGLVGVTDYADNRDNNATWTSKAHIWIPGALAAGRTPVRAVLLQAQPSGGERVYLQLIELKGR
jgi:hypothetical protein